MRSRPGSAVVAVGNNPFPATTAGFIEEQAGYAEALGRPDIAAAAARLVATEPRSSVRAITHATSTPSTSSSPRTAPPSLIDWTVACVAHPGFTLGFTDLLLANPPIPLPKAGAALLGSVGRNIARRFLSTYRMLTDGTAAAVDDENLEWHRRVHALRILVELAGWDASGTRPASGLPWLILEPGAQRSLGIAARP